MNKKDLAYFRTKLEDMSANILTEAEKTISDMTDHTDNYPDPTDRASAESDRSFELRIRDRERKLLNKIKEAIERIGPVFFQFYGQSEAPMTITVLRKAEHDVNDLRRLASCGRPVPRSEERRVGKEC